MVIFIGEIKMYHLFSWIIEAIIGIALIVLFFNEQKIVAFEEKIFSKFKGSEIFLLAKKLKKNIIRR